MVVYWVTCDFGAYLGTSIVVSFVHYSYLLNGIVGIRLLMV